MAANQNTYVQYARDVSDLNDMSTDMFAAITPPSIASLLLRGRQW